ncbi:fimbrial protein, partial [Salmonella enterica subsp. enterica serovar Typhi]|nr:fimbrial protein [Salmonella enterica subsp. enterica serovar Typhi]
QTRIKVFYRPQALSKIDMQHPWQYKITLQRQGNGYQVSNTTGYYVVLSNASNRMDGTPARGFSPLVIAPKSNVTLGGDASELGRSPVLTYVNDYGARLPLIFNCTDNSCAVDEAKSRKS